ncbi:MAG: hypothetical protein IJ877_04565 [Candidatus Gastranaerophilales bacterium]|nr:hypothetical protein [Candidatus Gastranaerophilales bacterium]
MENVFQLKKGESLFLVDLESVTFLNEDSIIKTASVDEKYFKMPFLYMISSYMRNQAINWANEKYVYQGKKKIGSWMIYKFSAR